MSSQKIIRTNASLFLLPGIGLSIRAIKGEGFINAFISDETSDNLYPYSLFLLFKPADKQVFNDMFVGSEYMRTPLLIDEYDYSGGYVVLVYKFPEQFQQDYNLFLRGGYSEFSEEYKSLFPMEVDSEDEVGPFQQHSFYYHVFNKTKELEKYWYNRLGMEIDKDKEYWQTEIDKEVLNIEKLTENERKGDSKEIS